MKSAFFSATFSGDDGEWRTFMIAPNLGLRLVNPGLETIPICLSDPIVQPQSSLLRAHISLGGRFLAIMIPHDVGR